MGNSCCKLVPTIAKHNLFKRFVKLKGMIIIVFLQYLTPRQVARFSQLNRACRDLLVARGSSASVNFAVLFKSWGLNIGCDFATIMFQKSLRPVLTLADCLRSIKTSKKFMVRKGEACNNYGPSAPQIVSLRYPSEELWDATCNRGFNELLNWRPTHMIYRPDTENTATDFCLGFDCSTTCNRNSPKEEKGMTHKVEIPQ